MVLTRPMNGLHLLIVGICSGVLIPIVSASGQVSPTDRQEFGRLTQAVGAADRRGDFKTAAAVAKSCLAIGQSLPPKTVGSYCQGYLANALLKGRGIPHDAQWGISLLRPLVVKYPDESYGLDLAEAYLDGNGVSRDSVEAAILTWRFDHGFWSSYGPYGGMCDANSCDAMWAQAKALDERLSRQLTTAQKADAISIEAARYPEVAQKVQTQDRRDSAIGFAILAAICGGIWLCLRRWRRLSQAWHSPSYGVRRTLTLAWPADHASRMAAAVLCSRPVL